MLKSKQVGEPPATGISAAHLIKSCGLFKKLILSMRYDEKTLSSEINRGLAKLLLQYATLTKSEQDECLLFARLVLEYNG